MNVKRSAYILLAVSMGYETIEEISAATGLPDVAVKRTLRDHRKKLMVEVVCINGRYSVTNWGLIGIRQLRSRMRALASELNLPEIQERQHDAPKGANGTDDAADRQHLRTDGEESG